MKKTLTLAVVLALVLSCLSFAGAESTSLSEPGTLPIWTGDEPAVISVLMTPSDFVSDFDDNAYTKNIEENCNVDLQFVFLPSTDGKEKLNIMVAAGETLPDVVCVNLAVDVSKSYGDAGALIDLSEYYDAGLAVNIDAAVEKFPTWNLITNLTNPDGTIYSTPKIQNSPSNETKYKMWINEGWLKNLNIEVPTTTDEFYDMLVRFKNEDANGNGDATDEIPFVTTNGWGGTPTKFLTNAFVFEGDGDMVLLVDGKVSTSYVQDAWFDAVEYVKKLCDEGLLAKESFTYSNTELLPISASPDDLVGATTNSSLGYMGNVGSENYEYRLRYICIDPLKGPEGVQYSSYAQSATNGQWHVTKYAENPELCFRVGDFQFTEECFLLGRFGVEGENWATVEDYTKDHNVQAAARYAAMGYEGKYLFYNDIFGTVQNLNWYDMMPYFSGTVECEGAYISVDEDGTVTSAENNCTVRQESASGVYQTLIPGMDVYVPNLNFTAEELELISEARANIRTYVNEQRTNYIIGQPSDLENKEAFLENLYSSFELDTILEVANTAYARQYGAN